MSSFVNYNTHLFPILSEDETYSEWSAALAAESREAQEREIAEAQARHVNELFDRVFGM